jgi:hypothetical protein
MNLPETVCGMPYHPKLAKQNLAHRKLAKIRRLVMAENKIFTVLVGKDHSEKVHDSISIDPLIKACPKLENLYGIDLTNKIGLDEMYHVIKGSPKLLITM